ncbi:aconitate hydratase [Pseudomonas aeruginosa]|nr:aconitate hydratase [Pseudomonas aeruginosa]
MFAVGFKHSISLISGPGGHVSRNRRRSARQTQVDGNPPTYEGIGRFQTEAVFKVLRRRAGVGLARRLREAPSPAYLPETVLVTL